MSMKRTPNIKGRNFQNRIGVLVFVKHPVKCESAQLK